MLYRERHHTLKQVLCSSNVYTKAHSGRAVQDLLAGGKDVFDGCSAAGAWHWHPQHVLISTSTAIA